MKLKAVQVFTPNDFPTHTYVKRADDRLEERLSEALDTPKAVISISGPSKSGKTVLVEKMVGNDNLIIVSGAQIAKIEDLWDRTLDWMGAPSTTAIQDQTVSGSTTAGKMSATGKLPFFGETTGEGSYQRIKTNTDSITSSYSRSGLTQVVQEIADSAYTVLIDDFHYMPRSLQSDAAKQIKAAAERGVRMCIASVPHRADDVVRSNSELRGRTTNLDTSFWTSDELINIAATGFEALNVGIPAYMHERFAREACGSPQLMQTICLKAAYRLGAREAFDILTRPTIGGSIIEEVFEESALTSDYSSLLVDMHQGPKTRGTERKEFSFKDGSRGDVYRAVLLAIALDPPAMSIPYPELMQRIKSACSGGEAPVGRSVTETCDQIAKFAEAKYPDQRIVEFDSEGGSDTFSIVDPYWLFYLRSSPKLATLGVGDTYGSGSLPE